MSFEGGDNREPLSKRKTLEGVLRDLKQIRPDSYKGYKVKESDGGISIMIGENSIIDEHLLKDRYEIFPSVNGETIEDLFGDYPDEVCRYLTLEQAINIAEAAERAKQNPSKLPELKKTIDGCYPDGFPESPIAMALNLARAHKYTKPGFPGFIEDRIDRQYKRHIEGPRRKKEEENKDE